LIDIHSHLLAGVDDGVKTREEASALLDQYHKHGFTHIVCTPHFNDPHVNTDILRIRGEFEWLSFAGKELGITILLGSENYIGSDEGKFIPFLSKFMLVETDPDFEPLFLLDRIFAYQLRGFTIILAHVERFAWFSIESKSAVRMREMGVLFQVNANSLKSRKVQHYVEADWVDFIASDNHGTSRTDIDFQRWLQYDSINTRSMRILGL
jgi:protein-tyrosine phosphatase